MQGNHVKHYSELSHAELDELLDTSLAELVVDGGLTMRIVNALERNNIYTVRDILNTTSGDLLKIYGIGKTTINVIFLTLANIGFYNRPSLKAPK